MTLAEILATLGEHVWNLWPLRIVSEWETGLRLTRGKITATLGPGLHWFWPIIGEIAKWDTVLDVNTVANQTVETADGETVVFALSARYRIADMAKLFREIQDYEATILNQIGASAAGLVTTMDFEDIPAQLGNAVHSDLHARLEEWGIELQEVQLFNFARVRAFRLIQ